MRSSKSRADAGNRRRIAGSARQVGLARRRRGASLLAAFAGLGMGLVAACGSGAGRDAEAAVAQARLQPGLLVSLPDGRKINFRCRGRGAPVVILESGFASVSTAWFRVQPLVAKTTKVCAYDRAGSGFSDPGPLPRDGAAIARDLDQALDAAGIEGPYIVAAHSAGGLYARLFAARRPSEVKGLVLVDPTVERIADDRATDGLEGMRRRRQRCLTVAEMSPRPPRGDALWMGCIPTKAADNDLAVAERPASWRGEISELDALFGRTSAQVVRARGVIADIPAYVITASDTAASAPTVGYDKPQSTWELQHIGMALGFRHGAQRTVLSSHRIMIDRPEVVADAILAMVDAARAGRPPEPLAVSETAPMTEEAFPQDPPATN